jgi:hypothetical protein
MSRVTVIVSLVAACLSVAGCGVLNAFGVDDPAYHAALDCHASDRDVSINDANNVGDCTCYAVEALVGDAPPHVPCPRNDDDVHLCCIQDIRFSTVEDASGQVCGCETIRCHNEVGSFSTCVCEPDDLDEHIDSAVDECNGEHCCLDDFHRCTCSDISCLDGEEEVFSCTALDAKCNEGDDEVSVDSCSGISPDDVRGIF